ncbi:SDR family oxidoreductase [Actinomadura sp. B10D3]|uniref:SDR family NAD(P)-dependent oxidoreductase n=1 Tax=Actinomadura sp. B10D3 TaxID=3153557 RepID=UPI00325F872E
MEIIMSLSGKALMVTGASRGIGLAIATGAIAQGARVAGVARTISPELKAAGAHPVPVDLATGEGPGEAVRQAVDMLGGLDVLINNVGAFDARLDGFGAITDAQWQHTFEVNFFSAVRAIRAALPSLLERQGAIVNVSSIRGRFPQPPTVDYGTSKAALTNLGKALAEELGPRGVRVNSVSPGPTRTPAWESETGIGATLAAANGTTVTELLAGLPAKAGFNTGRLTEPDEVAALVLFLASGQARNINGADYIIDGGQSKTA